MIETTLNIKHKTSKALGELIRYQEHTTGLECHISNGYAHISVYGPGIFKIHIAQSEELDHNPFSVVAQPDQSLFTVNDANDCITVSTDLADLEISKSPVRFILKTKDGQVIIEDDQSFGTSFIGEQITTYKKLQHDERFIGLGEKTGPLNRRGSGYQHWNTDHFGYGPDSDPLYCSTPFYIGLHNGLQYGLYLDNPHKSHFNFGASNDRFSSISVDGGDMCYYLIYGKTVSDILTSYGKLTGYMPMPPKWSIGYQQCRYSYYPDHEVRRVADTFREKEIPADVIVLDIHYMDQYKIFTWDNKHFPDPQALIAYLKDKGFHVVVMCDPGIKIEDGYEAYESGKAHDLFVKYPDGTNYSGSVWPGLCHFPDFTMEKTRAWWQEQMQAYTSLGVDGFWNDMNEIATWGQMLPELIEFDFEGDRATARKGRNVYGFQMCRATYEGTKASLNGKRPFNLTRAGFSGVQRYAAVWTGDNVASDEHMLVGVRLVNSLGLAGVAFAGYDVGGFVGNSNEALFARWVQIGAFSPFFRGHSMINSRDSEPWSYGEEVEEISRNYIRLRYKLMPYLYSAFFEASQSGIPVARSLAISHAHEDRIYDEQFQNQYTFGQAILVAPVESTNNLVKVWLPDGEWFELFTDTLHTGNQVIVAECGIERLPLYVRGSSIIPVYPDAGQHTRETGDVLEYHIYAGTTGNTFLHYDDDGETFDYEQGVFSMRKIDYDPQARTITIGAVEGGYRSLKSTVRICLHGFDDTMFEVNGQSQSVSTTVYRFIEPISNFDPFGNETGENLKITDLKYLQLENTTDAITIRW